MPWARHDILMRFQALVNALVDLRMALKKQPLKKDKYKENFNFLRAISEAGYHFLFAEDMPEEAEKTLTLFSNNINEQLRLIGKKKSGGENNTQFNLAQQKAQSELLNSFTNACRVEIKKNVADSVSKQNVGSGQPGTMLDTPEKLLEKIQSLGAAMPSFQLQEIRHLQLNEEMVLPQEQNLIRIEDLDEVIKTWASHKLNKEFEALVDAIISLYYGLERRNEYQPWFNYLRSILDAGLRLLFTERMPKEALQQIDYFSQNIVNQLRLIRSMKVGSQDIHFYEAKAEVLCNLSSFIGIGKGEIQANLNKKNDMQTQSTWDQEDSLRAHQLFEKIKTLGFAIQSFVLEKPKRFHLSQVILNTQEDFFAAAEEELNAETVSWASKDLKKYYQAVIESLTALHLALDKKEKYQKYFNTLSLSGLFFENMFVKEKPEGIEVGISSFSNSIMQALILIGEDKKGGKNNPGYNAAKHNIIETFAAFRNTAECEANGKEADSIYPDILSKIKKLDTPEDIFEKIQSLQTTAPKLELINTIAPFKAVQPTQAWPTLFPSQKLALAAMAMTGLSFFYFMLTMFSDNFGKAMDDKIHANETGIDHKIVISGFLLFVGIGFLIASCAKSRLCNDKVEEPRRLGYTKV